ncbi:MAG: hypothetical protein ACLFPR_09130 [Desulfococcaceae bacterium]
MEAIFSIGRLKRGAVPPDPEPPVAPVAKVAGIRGKTALSQPLPFGGSNAVPAVSAGAEVSR